VINITTKTTIVSNVQLDDNIRRYTANPGFVNMSLLVQFYCIVQQPPQVSPVHCQCFPVYLSLCYIM